LEREQVDGLVDVVNLDYTAWPRLVWMSVQRLHSMEPIEDPEPVEDDNLMEMVHVVQE
jgi:hypothetical protein